MNKYQFRAIRNSFQRDKVYSVGNGWHNDLIDYPIMRKKVEEISIHGKLVKPKDIRISMTLTKGKNVYKSYYIDYNHSSQIFRVITLNDRIVYWISSNIGAEIQDTFHIFTMVFHYYSVSWLGSWQLASKDDFDCIDHFWDNYNWKEDKIHLRSHLSPFRLEMLEKTGKVYIDKCICPIFDGHLELPKTTHWL